MFCRDDEEDELLVEFPDLLLSLPKGSWDGDCANAVGFSMTVEVESESVIKGMLAPKEVFRGNEVILKEGRDSEDDGAFEFWVGFEAWLDEFDDL